MRLRTETQRNFVSAKINRSLIIIYICTRFKLILITICILYHILSNLNKFAIACSYNRQTKMIVTLCSPILIKLLKLFLLLNIKIT